MSTLKVNSLQTTDGSYTINIGDIGSGITDPGGANTQIQFNDGGAFGGNANLTYNKTTGTLSVANLSVSGNISGGSVANAAYADVAGVANSVAGANVSGVVANATYAATAGAVALANVTGIGNIANINLNGNASQVLLGNGAWGTGGGTGSVSNVTGNGSGLGFTLSGSVTSAGNLDLAVPSASALRTNLGLGNLYALNKDGNASNVLYGNGVFASAGSGGSGSVTSVGITAGSGITVSNSPITSSGNITVTNDGIISLTAGNNISISSGANPTLSVDTFSFAKESLTVNANASTGTINLDVLGNAITYYTGNATGNVTLNIRGSSSVTLNNTLSNNQSVTATFVMKTGATGYTANVFKIDGSNVTPKWAGGLSPYVSSNTTTAITLTSIKTAANTYTVLGSFTGYF